MESNEFLNELSKKVRIKATTCSVNGIKFTCHIRETEYIVFSMDDKLSLCKMTYTINNDPVVSGNFSYDKMLEITDKMLEMN